ncbi:hypothetical protein [Sphingomonas astaxanthinifaciens]|uniref:hypothetical protein n=1 Tax=Sphingomonas astaxanthinifaciens TaxID=407019 RepID=UPI0012EC5889|nr:hypothetical protein [Sphingomonas astaxanthinifaciens]
MLPIGTSAARRGTGGVWSAPLASASRCNCSAWGSSGASAIRASTCSAVTGGEPLAV